VQLQMANLQAISDDSSISILDPADIIPFPTVPKLLYAAVMSIIVGLFLTLAILFLQSSLDKSVRSADELALKLRGNVLASIDLLTAKPDEAELVRLGAKLSVILDSVGGAVALIDARGRGGIEKGIASDAHKACFAALKAIGHSDLGNAEKLFIPFDGSGARAVYNPALKNVRAAILVASPGKRVVPGLLETIAACRECDLSVAGWIYSTRS